MDAVMLAREDDVPVLQEHHPGRQAEVGVRPLVDLVGERHKDGQCKQVAVPGVDMVDLRCRKEAVRRGQTVMMGLIWKKLFSILSGPVPCLMGGRAGGEGRGGEGS